MDKDEVMRDDSARDLMAARAELVARRDQIIDDYEDRLAALDKVDEDLAAGKVVPRAAQAQIRRILGGERGAIGPRQAGRTKIGMSVPAAQAAQSPLPKASPNKGTNPPAVRVNLAVSRTLAQVDEQISRTLMASRVAQGFVEGRFLLALLLHLRRSLARYGEGMPKDAVLMTSITEYVEHVQAVLADLEAGGATRLRRLLDHCRAVASELSALGGDMDVHKAQIAQARKMLAAKDPNCAEILKRAHTTFTHLRSERTKLLPLKSVSLIDELLL